MKEKKLKTVLNMSFMAILLLALPVSAATPRLNKTSTSVYIGKTVQLKVTGKKNSKIKWKSSNSNIAFVSSSGKVTGKRKELALFQEEQETES
nr:Ig-like domain-containing protein [uncultured Blautia sp.]